MKKLFNKNVISALVSLTCAFISAYFAGCKLAVGELSVKDTSVEVLSYLCETNNLNGVN